MFSVYKIPKECEPSVLAPSYLPALQPFASALELAEHKFGFYQEDSAFNLSKTYKRRPIKVSRSLKKLRSCYSIALGYDEPQQDVCRQQHYERPVLSTEG